MTADASDRTRKVHCSEVAGHVQQELDSRLHDATLRTIRDHVRICPNCAAYLDSLKKTVLLYRRLPSPHVSKRTRDRLFAVLRLRMKTH